MELIDNGTTRIQAIVRAVIRRERFHRASFQVVDDRVAKRCEVVLQIGSLDNSHGIREADLRLVFDRCSGIDLRTRLPIGKEHIEGDAGRKSGLAVLAGNLNVGVTETACPIGMFPAKNIPHHKLLPRLKTKTATGPLAFGMLQAFDEVDGTNRFSTIKKPTSVESHIQVAVISTDSQTNILTRQNLS